MSVRQRHVLARLLPAAALVAAAVGLGVPAPATAAGCATASGVTVVVDFNELGGGVSSGCVAGGGGQRASDLFPAAGHPLTYAQRQPGFVCRVSGAPADDPCVNTSPGNAYWGLWWSDGEGGGWVYSSLGADSLTVPDGGYVALSWDGTGGDATPGFTPAAHPSATPTPTPQPTPQPPKPAPGNGGNGNGNGADRDASPDGDQAAGGSSAAPTGQPTPGSVPSPSGEPSRSASAPGGKGKAGKAGASEAPSGASAPSATPSAGSSAVAPVSDDPVAPTAADASDDGLPAWVAPALIVVLFAVAGGVFLVRRRQTTP